MLRIKVNIKTIKPKNIRRWERAIIKNRKGKVEQ